jgi:hypothetical protein
MRKAMFTEHKIEGAVFIGGMKGILEEFELLVEIQPDALVVPILSTGGAAAELGERLKTRTDDLKTDLDYVAVLHRHLRIDVRELRYQHPNEQPADIESRLWKLDDPKNIRPNR